MNCIIPEVAIYPSILGLIALIVLVMLIIDAHTYRSLTKIEAGSFTIGALFILATCFHALIRYITGYSIL